MRRHTPQRVAALVLLGAILWPPTAAAAQTPTVTFSGTPLLKLGTLSCPSTPSVGELTVTAGTTVHFVDHLGKPATLHVGDWTAAIADGGTVPVTFPKAEAVSVTMIPKCVPDVGSHQAMTVTVCAAGSTPKPSVSATVAGPTSATGPTSTAGKPVVHGTEQQQAAAHSSATPTATPSPTPTVIAAGIPSEPRPPASSTLVLIAIVALVMTSAVWIHRARERGWRLL
jgi:hypothetical protein